MLTYLPINIMDSTICIELLRGFPGGSVLKNPPDKQATWFDPWVGKVPREKEMAIHSAIPAWEIPWTEEPGELQSMGVTKSGTRLSD